MPYTNDNWGRTGFISGESNSYAAPTADSDYKTAEDFGGYYGFGSKINEWLTGNNHQAESAADNYNTALTNAFNAAEAEKNRNFNAAEAEKERTYNAAEAEKSRKWQEEMSNTAYQRMMADAKAAGINPLYLVSSNGASTPSGATATAGAASGSAATGTTAKSTHKQQNQKRSNAATTALTLAKLAAIILA